MFCFQALLGHANAATREWGYSRAEFWSVKLVQVLGRKFRTCKPCSRLSSGIFPFPDMVYTPNPAPDTSLSLCFPTEGEGDISLLVRRRRPRSFMSVSSEPLRAFRPNLHRHIIGMGKEVINFCDLDLIFNVKSSLWMSIFYQKQLVCTLSLESNNGFRPNTMYCIIGAVTKVN